MSQLLLGLRDISGQTQDSRPAVEHGAPTLREKPEALYRRARHLQASASPENLAAAQAKAEKIFERIIRENPHSEIGAKAQRQLDILRGHGSFVDQFEYRGQALLHSICRPDTMAATLLAPMASQMGRVGALLRLTRPGGLTQHWMGYRGVQSLAYGLGFLTETTVFTGTHKIVGQIAGNPQDWHPLSLWQEWHHGASMLLGMKVMGAAGSQLQQRINRFNSLKAGFSAQMLSRISTPLIPEISAIGGTMLVPWLENLSRQGLDQNYQDLFYSGLELHLSFKGMNRALGTTLSSWKQFEHYLHSKAKALGDGQLIHQGRRLLAPWGKLSYLSPWHPPLALAMSTPGQGGPIPASPSQASGQIPKTFSKTTSKSWDQAWEFAQKFGTPEGMNLKEIVEEISSLLGEIDALAPKQRQLYRQKNIFPRNLLVKKQIQSLLQNGEEVQTLQAVYVELCGIHWSLTQAGLPAPSTETSPLQLQTPLIRAGLLVPALFVSSGSQPASASPVAALWSRGALYGKSLREQTPPPENILQLFHHAIRTNRLNELLMGEPPAPPKTAAVEDFFQVETKTWKQAWKLSQQSQLGPLLEEMLHLRRATKSLLDKVGNRPLPKVVLFFAQLNKAIRELPKSAKVSTADLAHLQNLYLELSGLHWGLIQNTAAPISPVTAPSLETGPATPAEALWSHGALLGRAIANKTSLPPDFERLFKYAVDTGHLASLLDGTLALPKAQPVSSLAVKAPPAPKSTEAPPQLQDRLSKLISAEEYWQAPWRDLQDKSSKSLQQELEKNLAELTAILRGLEGEFPPGSKRRQLVEDLLTDLKTASNPQDLAALRVLSLQMSGFNAGLRGETPSPSQRLTAAQIRSEAHFRDAEGQLKFPLTAEEFYYLLRHKSCKTAGRALPRAQERWHQALSSFREGFHSVNPHTPTVSLSQTWADWLRQVNHDRTERDLPFPVSEAELIPLSHELGAAVGKLWHPQLQLEAAPLARSLSIQADEYTKVPPAQTLWTKGWFVGHIIRTQKQNLPTHGIEALASVHSFVFYATYNNQHNFNFLPPLFETLETASQRAEAYLLAEHTWPATLPLEARLNHQEIARDQLPILYKKLLKKSYKPEDFARDLQRLSAAITWGESELADYQRQISALSEEGKLLEYAKSHGLRNHYKTELFLDKVSKKLAAHLDELYRSYLKGEQDFEGLQRQFKEGMNPIIRSVVREIDPDRRDYFSSYNRSFR